MPEYKAPICLFTYNRLVETKKTIEALKENYLANQSDLFLFSDGAKNNENSIKVAEVRTYLKTVEGFKSVTIFESKTNKGLADSIIDGVTKILGSYEKVIVLEDDLVSSPNFLDFMNEGLHYYQDNHKIFSITGWSMELKSLNNIQNEFYVCHRMSSWGWGIWKDRWSKIQWDKEYFKSFTNSLKQQYLFRKGGSDMPGMLKDYLKGKNNSWAIRACYHQFENDLLTIAPKRSKINNIGFGKNATHTKLFNRFDQQLDNSLLRSFNFNNDINVNAEIVSEFKSKFSLLNRIKSKLYALWFY
nr:sugar transferase [uncultured Flavobacterium sp.]